MGSDDLSLNPGSAPNSVSQLANKLIGNKDLEELLVHNYAQQMLAVIIIEMYKYLL